MKFNTKELRKKLEKKGYSKEEIDDIMERYIESFRDPRLKEYKNSQGDRRKMAELTSLCLDILKVNCPELF